MFGLNAPVPHAVRQEAAAFLPLLGTAAQTQYTLIVKRLTVDDTPQSVMIKRIRQLLDDEEPFPARITTVETFDEPTSGQGTVIYLAVASPGLHTLHERLCTVVPPAPALEGSDYVPHITIGRTTDQAIIDTALARSIEPVSWTVDTLVFYDASTGDRHGRIELDD